MARRLVLAGLCLVIAAGCSAAPVSPPPPPPVGGAAAPEDSKNCPTTAAAKLGWGTPTRESAFRTALPPDWHPYGPEPGHGLEGTRTPSAITVKDGVVTIAATQDGTTGAMSWHPGQRYGRWEACVKSEAGRGGMNAVILLWPNAEDFPVGGEIDWMEIGADDRQETGFFLHFGRNNDQVEANVAHDATKWTAWAVEWTPKRITAFVNGKEWYHTTDTKNFPPRPMNMTMQLDYFPPAGGRTAMHMDWARQWAIPESEPSTLSLGPGDPATGQPELFPDRVPRELG